MLPDRRSFGEYLPKGAFLTQTIAMIAGPYLLVTGLGFLLSQKFYIRMLAGAAGADPVLINLSGAVHFIVGALVLLLHFRWSEAAQIAVTLLGAAAALKGAALIALPDLLLKAPRDPRAVLRLSAIGFCAAGGYFIYAGYLAGGALS